MRHLFYCIAGSHLYGLDTPESDTDKRGVFSYSPREMLTLRHLSDTRHPSWADIQLYELAKFMRLAAKSNPNIIELLWVPDEFVLRSTEAFKLLVANRDMFISKRAANAFFGYAKSEFLKAVRRNQEQGEDVAKSYDGKNISHSLRLMYSLGNILGLGEPIVNFSEYPDRREHLLAVKRGEYGSWDDMKELYDNTVRQVKLLKPNSELREEVNMNDVDELYVEVMRIAWGEDYRLWQ